MSRHKDLISSSAIQTVGKKRQQLPFRTLSEAGSEAT